MTEATRRQPALRASAWQPATKRHEKTNIASHNVSPHNDDKVSTQAVPCRAKACEELVDVGTPAWCTNTSTRKRT
jgi:hypothetical protein